jgi:hypothetical protein
MKRFTHRLGVLLPCLFLLAVPRPIVAHADNARFARTEFILIDPGGSYLTAMVGESRSTVPLRIWQLPAEYVEIVGALPYSVPVSPLPVPLEVKVGGVDTGNGNGPGNLYAKVVSSGRELGLDVFLLPTQSLPPGGAEHPFGYPVLITNLDKEQSVFLMVTVN